MRCVLLHSVTSLHHINIPIYSISYMQPSQLNLLDSTDSLCMVTNIMHFIYHRLYFILKAMQCNINVM